MINELGWIIPVAIVGGLLLVLLLALGIYYVVTYNKLKRYIVKIDEASSGIDVALTKRYDLLSKALEVTKGYAKHEAETIVRTTEMRTPQANDSMKEKSALEGKLGAAFASIMAVAENYPTLKADAVFVNLQNQVGEAEEELQSARRIYNSNVSLYNQEIAVFPNSLFFQGKNYEKKDFFEAEEKKKGDVEFKF